MKNFKELERKDLEDLILCGLTSTEIAEAFGISRKTLFSKLKNLDLSFNIYKRFNDSIFDTINSEEKSYWLGFLYADGYVCGYHNNIELSLTKDDIDHLIKFKRFLEDKKDDSVIKLSKVYNKKSNKEYTRCRYTIGDKHFHEQLVSLGCIPNKSKILKFPDREIFKETGLIYDFIRGYIDGDGCYYGTKHNRLAIEVLGTYKFLNGIREYIPYFSIPTIKEKESVYRITCSNYNADRTVELLYNNPKIYLERKYNKIASLYKLNSIRRKSGKNGKGCDVNTVLNSEITKGSESV